MCDVWEIQKVIMTPNDSGWWCLTAVLNNSQKYSMLKEEKKYSTINNISHWTHSVRVLLVVNTVEYSVSETQS